jgi:hypothetical protein
LLFTIDRQPVDANLAELSPANLALGNGAEVKGSITDGVLFADKIKLR